MALSDMKVFNEYLKRATIETLAQDVAKFNAASAGSIQLRLPLKSGVLNPC